MMARACIAKSSLLLALVAAAFAATAQEGGGVFDDQGLNANDPAYEEIRKWQAQEELGVQLFRNGDFDRAYELLAETARRGFKSSQHAMALMHLRGEGVDQNQLKGAALLGLAAESGDKRLTREYKKLFKTVPDKYKGLVEQQVAYYVERYGMEAQGVACSMKKLPQSNRRAMECVKQPGTYPEHPWAP